MARNTRASNGMKKIEPSVMTMQFTFNLTGDATIDNYTLDLSQCASILNRRFYRQGLNWAVVGFKFLGTDESTLSIQKLPSTWVMSNAWEKGFRSWQKMNNEALQEAESVKPKFLDFKIYADATHHSAGFAANLLPGNYTPTFTQAVAGEWSSSKLLIPLTGASVTDPGQVTEREIIATGANYPGVSPVSGLNSVSLIEGYANSRALPNIVDPNVPADAADADGGTAENWMSALFNEGTQQTDEVLGVLIDENNIAPYPFENDGVNVDTMYPGGANQVAGLETHDIEFITPTTIGGTTHMKGGMFPCGLVRVQAQKSTAGGGVLQLQVDMVPGDHRGYLASPMTEM